MLLQLKLLYDVCVPIFLCSKIVRNSKFSPVFKYSFVLSIVCIGIILLFIIIAYPQIQEKKEINKLSLYNGKEIIFGHTSWPDDKNRNFLKFYISPNEMPDAISFYQVKMKENGWTEVLEVSEKVMQNASASYTDYHFYQKGLCEAEMFTQDDWSLGTTMQIFVDCHF